MSVHQLGDISRVQRGTDVQIYLVPCYVCNKKEKLFDVLDDAFQLIKENEPCLQGLQGPQNFDSYI